MLLEPSPGNTGRGDRLVDIDIASTKTANTGADDGDCLGALARIAQEEVGDEGESEPVVLAGPQAGRDGQRVCKATDGVGRVDIDWQSTAKVGVGSVDVKTLGKSSQQGATT